jgi:hypothetical protein
MPKYYISDSVDDVVYSTDKTFLPEVIGDAILANVLKAIEIGGVYTVSEKGHLSSEDCSLVLGDTVLDVLFGKIDEED